MSAISATVVFRATLYAQAGFQLGLTKGGTICLRIWLPSLLVSLIANIYDIGF